MPLISLSFLDVYGLVSQLCLLLVAWRTSAASLILGDINLAQLFCSLNDVMFCFY
jgi:hypothetical protein